ncbi:MAG TPA: DUF6600 domain-containing protein [Hanamia sp.]|jgi:hypothetical protein|nr:DUF6600 domain-containing protein [Hanamia sp.]
MKHLYNISLLLILIGISSCSSSRYYQGNSDEYDQSYSQQQPQITYQQFYNDLSPYGNWMNYGEYGYVWIPSQPGFRPYYSNGHWVYTNYGWTWASDYSWGWAPFHYGRWMQDMSYGWMWVPGYEWAPAWVTWRGGGDYYGWAPLGPGMNANISAGSIPYNNWAFVPSRYISNPRINNYYVSPSRNVTIINNTTIINNNTVINNGNQGRPVYNPGPPVREVEQTTGSRIKQYNVVQAGKPGTAQISNNTLRVFRPVVNQSTTNNSNAQPQRVVTPDQIRTQNTVPNRNNINNETAPVRQIPKEQTPQINRNEPPVNAPQRVVPNRNNTTPRVSPEYQQPENRTQQNPVIRNPQPQNNPAQNTPPSRTFRQSGNQPVNRNTVPQNNISREPVRKEQQLNPAQNNSVNPEPRTPVRRFSNTTPSNNQQTNQMRQTEQSTRQVVRQKSDIDVVKPAQTVRELKPERKEE